MPTQKERKKGKRRGGIAEMNLYSLQHCSWYSILSHMLSFSLLRWMPCERFVLRNPLAFGNRQEARTKLSIGKINNSNISRRRISEVSRTVIVVSFRLPCNHCRQGVRNCQVTVSMNGKSHNSSQWSNILVDSKRNWICFRRDCCTLAICSRRKKRLSSRKWTLMICNFFSSPLNKSHLGMKESERSTIRLELRN